MLIILERSSHVAYRAAEETISVYQPVDWQYDVLVYAILQSEADSTREVLLPQPGGAGDTAEMVEIIQADVTGSSDAEYIYTVDAFKLHVCGNAITSRPAAYRTRKSGESAVYYQTGASLLESDHSSWKQSGAYYIG